MHYTPTSGTGGDLVSPQTAKYIMDLERKVEHLERMIKLQDTFIGQLQTNLRGMADRCAFIDPSKPLIRQEFKDCP